MVASGLAGLLGFVTRKRVPPESRALLEHARRNEASAPRKHHLVPASYLRRWADAGAIRVPDVETRHSYPTSPEKAARITDFYRLEADELDPQQMPPLLFESLLSEVEGWAKAIIDELLTQPEELSPDDAAKFAWFMGFQFTRGSAHRAGIRWVSGLTSSIRLRPRKCAERWR
jgi:hypothetical protein